MFIGDIDSRLQHGNALSFADGTRIMMKIKQPEDFNELHEDLNVVDQWAEDNHMMFNAGNFQHIKYGVNPPHPVSYKALNGSEFETQTNVRDLVAVLFLAALF